MLDVKLWQGCVFLCLFLGVLLASFSLTIMTIFFPFRFHSQTSLNTLPDYLELPSGGAPPPPPAVVEAISAVTKAAPPAPKIAESVTSSLPAVPDVSLPSVSLPDISDVSTSLRN